MGMRAVASKLPYLLATSISSNGYVWTNRELGFRVKRKRREEGEKEREKRG